MRRIGVHFLHCGSQRLHLRRPIAERDLGKHITQFDPKRDAPQGARCRNAGRSAGRNPRDERILGACYCYSCCPCYCAGRLDFGHRL